MTSALVSVLIACLPKWAEQNQPKSPYSHFQYAAALALLGHSNEAWAATQAGLALDPGFTLRRLRLFPSSNDPAGAAAGQRIYKGMRMAGVPEG